jgi:hypothetical protein
LELRDKLIRLLRFGYGFALFFALISVFVIWALPLVAISLGATAFLVSDATYRAGRGFNIRGLVIAAGGVFVVFFAIYYAILGLGLDLQTTETAQQQGSAYLEMATTFGLMSATGLVTLTVCGLLAIVKAHREIRLKP